MDENSDGAAPAGPADEASADPSVPDSLGSGHRPEDLDPATAGLAAVTLELARETAGTPLPAPRLYALVGTAALLAAQPAFASVLDEPTIAQAAGDPHHLTPVELDVPRGARDPIRVLQDAEWPDIAAGGAIAADLDADRWAERAPGEDASLSGTGTLRVVAAARPDGTTWCAVRTPDSSTWRIGARLLPDLTAALAESVIADA